jgi:hypothetical protein
LSFANAAKKDAALLDKKFEESAGDENKNIVVEEVAEKVADVAIWALEQIGCSKQT